MLNRTKSFILGVTAVLICSTSASAAIFEMQNLRSAATRSGGTGIHAPENRAQGLYQRASTDRMGDLQLPSLNMGMMRPEDLLWIAMGDASLAANPASHLNFDAALHSAEADHLLAQKIGHASTVHAPTEGTAPEIWAVILIGAGLIWSQLRRKTRNDPIRFTVP
jgi:hypothetical protein